MARHRKMAELRDRGLVVSTIPGDVAAAIAAVGGAQWRTLGPEGPVVPLWLGHHLLRPRETCGAQDENKGVRASSKEREEPGCHQAGSTVAVGL